MGRYRSMRKCEEIGEVVVMTRARAAAHSVTADVRSGRKRKVNSCDEELSRSSKPLIQLKSRRRRLFVSTPENSAEKAAASSNSNDPYASCCSSNGSIELENDASKFVDLEEEEITVLGTPTYDLQTCRDRRETTPSSSEVRVECAEMESTARPSASQANSRLQTTDEKMPSEAELEEFFSTAEKNIHQQFAQKYNFDILKEEPLDGRYEWVRLDP